MLINCIIVIPCSVLPASPLFSHLLLLLLLFCCGCCSCCSCCSCPVVVSFLSCCSSSCCLAYFQACPTRLSRPPGGPASRIPHPASASRICHHQSRRALSEYQQNLSNLSHMSSDHHHLLAYFAATLVRATHHHHTLARLDPCRQPHPRSLPNHPSLNRALAFFYLAPSPHASLFTGPPFRISPARTLLPSPLARPLLSTVSLSFRDDSRTTMRSTMSSVRAASQFVWGVEPSPACQEPMHSHFPHFPDLGAASIVLFIFIRNCRTAATAISGWWSLFLGVTRSLLASSLTHSLTHLLILPFCRLGGWKPTMPTMTTAIVSLRPRCELPTLSLYQSRSLGCLSVLPSPQHAAPRLLLDS